MDASLRRYGLVAAASAVLGMLMCSNPTDQDPVKWRAALQVPITNQEFNLAEQLDDAIHEVRLDTFIVCTAIDDTVRGDGSGIRDTIYDCDSIIDTLVTRVLYVDSTYYSGSAVLEPDTILGDVVALTVPERNVSSFQITVDSLEDKRFDVTVGPIPLSGNRTIAVGRCVEVLE